MGPARVWLKDQDIPGLAMSRSFGDEVAASAGTIAHPEIIEWKLTPEDKFLILASDGVWEFIDSEEVNFNNLVCKFYKRFLF
jgi:serine/threonine protein phosphatase PrpC